ncbi:GNAT family N-acetyltransferase [Labedella endophytica]|uniref:GNAT family N-acetyltransferase n=1 Tax=Labedella endophytica TaxID=1523160 RepID=UPI001AA0A1DE|nr:GNAT family N-acetyltransferase [Labedella endophytica]
MSGTRTYVIDTDLERIDLAKVHHWLSTDAFWALGRSQETVERAAKASLNFGVYDAAGGLCAYARVVTDRATFAWLCDVYVDRDHRGEGLGLLLAQAVVDELAPMDLKRVLLSTADAHGLYEKAGFVTMPDPHKLMVLEPARTNES